RSCRGIALLQNPTSISHLRLVPHPPDASPALIVLHHYRISRLVRIVANDYTGTGLVGISPALLFGIEHLGGFIFDAGDVVAVKNPSDVAGIVGCDVDNRAFDDASRPEESRNACGLTVLLASETIEERHPGPFS